MEKNMHGIKVDAPIKPANSKSVEKDKAYFQNMPKATSEQVRLAKLLSNSSDDAEIQNRVRQIQECTDCSTQQAVAALHDCDNDVQRAIEYLLDKNSDANDWQTTKRKSAKSKRLPVETSKSSLIASSVHASEANHDVSHGSQAEMDHLPGELKYSSAFDQTNRRKPGKTTVTEQKLQQKPSEKSESPGITNNVDLIDYLSSGDCNANWDDADHGDWKGEAIEIVNSNSFPVNINEDIELLKLATTEPEVKTPPKSAPLESIEQECNVIHETQKNPASVPENEQNSVTGTAESVRSKLFARFAISDPPKVSNIPDVPVFFAPGANAASKCGSPFGDHLVQKNDASNSESAGISNASAQQNMKNKSTRQHEKKAKSKSAHFDKNVDEVLEPRSNQCERPPELNSMFPAAPPLAPLIETSSDRSYPPVLHNESTLSDPYAHMQDHESTHNRAANLNSFVPPNSFNNYILDEISQNIGKVSLSTHVNKADAFTQSISSNQLDTSSQYHSLQSMKQSAPQNQIGKLGQSIQSNASQPSLPSTQAHPQMNPYMPQLISQLHSSFPMFNMHGGSSASQQLLELEQLQALQQQRFLFEMQQQQLNSSESSLPNTCSDVMSSSKSTAPLNHIAATNAGLRPDLLASALGHHQMLGQAAAAPFLPYPSIFLMNGYPNPFLNQQQVTQPNVPQTQNSGHGGSPLTQNQPGQQQYIKGMNSTANYQGYQGLRQSTFDELADMSFQNMSKVGYKHNNQQAALYGSQPNQQNCDMSLSAKIQQSAVCQQNLVGSQQQSASHYANSANPVSQYSPYLQQHYMAAVSALVAQQNSASNAGIGGAGNLSVNAQMQGSNMSSGLHGSPVMVMGTQGSSMHQRSGAPQH